MVIGNTGIYNIGNRTYLKCEWQNLTGTPKARFVYSRINRLKRERVLQKDMTICDVSTGSEAAALAQFGSILGYKVHVWLPDYTKSSFVDYIKRYGAKVDFVDGDNWLLDGAKRARETAEEISGFYFNQADALEDAINAYGELGREFSSQLESMNVTPDALTCVIGSGGLLLGSAKKMKESFPNMKVYAIELNKAPYLHSLIHGYTPKVQPHHVWGIGSEESTRMKNELGSLVDDVLLIDEEEMRDRVENIPNQFGISVDYPTASNILGCEMLREKGLDDIATIWTGHGWRTLL